MAHRLLVATLLLLASSPTLSARQAPPAAPQDAPPAAPPAAGAPADPPPPPEPRGLRVKESGALPGYTLIAPLRSKIINLVDLDGRLVHKWETGFVPGSEYFLPNGNLLRASKEPTVPRFRGGGQCGRLQEIDWEGKVVWDWKFATDMNLQHHDLKLTPDGTILFIAWEYKTRDEAITAGRHPAHVGKDGLWPDCIFEIEPIKPDGAEIIWEWHVWDHLIQDIDPDAENYGNVAEHPERVDINADLRRPPKSDAEVADMKALGYIAPAATAGELSSDWLHFNAIDYHPGLDQIVVSTPELCEIWIVDHSTTSVEAATHEGGMTGRGGNLLYRWGNPRNYGAGGAADQRLFYQHNVRWIEPGLPGAGHLLLFNNGGGRPDGDYSAVLELVTPLQPDRTYGLEAFVPAQPEAPVWQYQAPDPKTFFSSFISGAQRLPNGNTQICEGAKGRVFEVTPDGRIVWDFLHDFTDAVTGDGGQPAPPHALFRATRIPADHPGLKLKVPVGG